LFSESTPKNCLLTVALLLDNEKKVGARPSVNPRERRKERRRERMKRKTTRKSLKLMRRFSKRIVSLFI